MKDRVFSAGEKDEVAIETGRRVWVQVVKGEIRVNGETARTSDAFAVWDEASLTIEASSDAEVLLFDLPPV